MLRRERRDEVTFEMQGGTAAIRLTFDLVSMAGKAEVAVSVDEWDLVVQLGPEQIKDLAGFVQEIQTAIAAHKPATSGTEGSRAPRPKRGR